MSRQRVALGAKNLQARLVIAVVVVAAALWLAHQQTEAGESTRGILEWLANALGALVTCVQTVFA